jgi:hypothetical protein
MRGMTFDDWMITTKTSNAAFAQLAGTTGETVRRYRSGVREPDTKMMALIFQLTSELVTPNDWAGVGPRSSETQSHCEQVIS